MGSNPTVGKNFSFCNSSHLLCVPHKISRDIHLAKPWFCYGNSVYLLIHFSFEVWILHLTGYFQAKQDFQHMQFKSATAKATATRCHWYTSQYPLNLHFQTCHTHTVTLFVDTVLSCAVKNSTFSLYSLQNSNVWKVNKKATDCIFLSAMKEIWN